MARALLPMPLALSLMVAAMTPALAVDATWGQVGPYNTFDGRSDPSTLCAYPNGRAGLASLRVRGPRVDFPDAGQVGWVTWKLLVQRQGANERWSTVARSERRRAVTVGFSVTFPTLAVPISGQAGTAPVRLVTRLNWFDQGNDPIGGARHAVRHYGLVRFGPGDADPIRFDDIERRTRGSCPNRWSS